MNEVLKQKERAAIEFLRSFERPEGYYLAFSGGKDSCVIKHLADKAGVKYRAVYHVTSVDPPELVAFIKKYHPDVEREIPRDSEGKPITMWNLIPKKGMLPTRIARYCCASLKEPGGDGMFAITGVRWAESVNRSKNQGRITLADKAAGREFADNENFTETVRGGGADKRQRRITQTARIVLQTAQNAYQPHYRLDGRGSVGIHTRGEHSVLFALRRGISPARLYRLPDGAEKRDRERVFAMAAVQENVYPRDRAYVEKARGTRLAERRSVFKRGKMLFVVDSGHKLRRTNDNV